MEHINTFQSELLNIKIVMYEVKNTRMRLTKLQIVKKPQQLEDKQ